MASTTNAPRPPSEPPGMDAAMAFFEALRQAKRQDKAEQEAASALRGAAIDGEAVEDLCELFDVPAPLAAAYEEYQRASDLWMEELAGGGESPEAQQHLEAAEAALTEACRGWADAEAAGPLLETLALCGYGGLGILHVSRAKHWHHQAAVQALEDGIPAERIRKHCTITTTGALDAGAVAALEEYERTRSGEDRKAAARARCWVDLHLYAHYSRWGSDKPAETVLGESDG